jgi:uncharacterized BrkB/YihY/UPF0761 family membrane protein
MSSVARVPEIAAVAGVRVAAAHVRAATRGDGADLCRGLLRRFRYGDGFSHSRALGFQLALAALPLLIAAIGFSAAWEAPSMRLVLQQTVLELTPGASDSLIRRTLPSPQDGATLAAPALVVALVSAVVALTTAMSQVERGANRIYGIQRDRPFAAKYGRALLLAVVAGVPVMAGSAVLVAGGAFAEAVETVIGVDGDVIAAVTWPSGVVLVVGAIAAMLRWCPARRQPGLVLLALGTGVAFASWLALTLLLAAFLQLSTDFGTVYGPLTGVIALLLWAQLTSAALFLGLAVSAELELRTSACALPATAVPARGSGRSRGVRPRDPPDILRRHTAGNEDLRATRGTARRACTRPGPLHGLLGRGTRAAGRPAPSRRLRPAEPRSQ